MTAEYMGIPGYGSTTLVKTFFAFKLTSNRAKAQTKILKDTGISARIVSTVPY